MRLTMLRRGEVDVQWTPNNENQCGYRRTQPELSKLWYEAEVMGDSDHLDSQGFIADQFQIHQTIVDCLSKPDVFKSCEQSCQIAAEAIWSRFGPDAQVQRICQLKLTVGAIGPDGDKWAGITAELGDRDAWHNDDLDSEAPLAVSSYEVDPDFYTRD